MITLNIHDHPSGTRFLNNLDPPDRVIPVEMEILSWSPSGRFVKLRIFENAQPHICWHTAESIAGILEIL